VFTWIIFSEEYRTCSSSDFKCDAYRANWNRKCFSSAAGAYGSSFLNQIRALPGFSSNLLHEVNSLYAFRAYYWNRLYIYIYLCVCVCVCVP
jgi:hypothetical protein